MPTSQRWTRKESCVTRLRSYVLLDKVFKQRGIISWMRAHQRFLYVEMLSLMNLIFSVIPVKQVTDETTVSRHEQVIVPKDEEPILSSKWDTTSGTSSPRTPTPVLKKRKNSTSQIWNWWVYKHCLLGKSSNRRTKKHWQSTKRSRIEKAADSECQSLMENETWKFVKLPTGRKPVGCKWIFK